MGDDDGLTRVAPDDEVLACTVVAVDSEYEVSENHHLLTTVKWQHEESECKARVLQEALIAQFSQRVEVVLELDELGLWPEEPAARLAMVLARLPASSRGSSVGPPRGAEEDADPVQ